MKNQTHPAVIAIDLIESAKTVSIKWSCDFLRAMAIDKPKLAIAVAFYVGQRAEPDLAIEIGNLLNCD